MYDLVPVCCQIILKFAVELTTSAVYFRQVVTVRR